MRLLRSYSSASMAVDVTVPVATDASVDAKLVLLRVAAALAPAHSAAAAAAEGVVTPASSKAYVAPDTICLSWRAL